MSADDKTDINNATFKINNTAYDPNVDNYGNFNVQEGKEYYLVHNEKGFKNFTEKAKQTGNVFTIKNATTYETSIKGLIKSYDEKDILIQGSKNVDRKIKNDDGSGFDNEELTRYGGSANGNTVNIGTTAGAGVDFAGLNVNAGSNANVNFIDGKNLGNISSAGGTLNIGKDRHNPLKPNTLSARNISGFKNINFFLPPNITNGDSMLKLTDPNAHTDLSNIGGKITAYISGNADSTPTSTVHLIKKEGNGLLKLPDASKLVARVVQGVSLRYENYYLTNNNNKSLDLNFDRLKTGAHTNVTMNPDTKSFAETRTAGLAALKSGSELITNYLDKLIPDGHLELFPFAIGEVHSLRYETGSHIDSKGYAVAAGLANLTPNSAGEILSGVFVEYGKANYDSYLDNGLHADGDSEYIGGGLMLKQNFTGGSYLDGSLHVGKISSDYNSNDWTYRALGGGVGHEEKFDISSTYFSTHLGIGHIFDLSESNKLDIYAKWLYARTQGASATITSGEKYDFASVKSNRLRAGLRDIINLKDEHNLYFGGAYEYEFDGVGKASFKGHEAPRPSLKGSTGVFEAGYKYDSKNLILSVGGKGYIGKTKGAAINAGFEVMF